MHILQPKTTRLKPEEVKHLLDKYRIAVSQLPKIRANDPSLPEGCQRGEVVKIERKDEDATYVYYRIIA